MTGNFAYKGGNHLQKGTDDAVEKLEAKSGLLLKRLLPATLVI